MGNFDQTELNKKQIIALAGLIERLSKRYGVDLSKTSISHKECAGPNCTQDMLDVYTPNLSGHRDVGSSSCPGHNMYIALPTIREMATFSHGFTPVTYPRSTPAKTTPKPETEDPIKQILEEAHIEARAPEDDDPMRTFYAPIIRDTDTIRIRLSYPHTDTIILQGYEHHALYLLYKGKKYRIPDTALTLKPISTDKLRLSI